MENLDFVQVAKIKVIGVGGGGCNAVSRMVNDKVEGVDFYVANTDLQCLNGVKMVDNKIVLGKQLTKGLGAGNNPELGRKAALESEEEIREALSGANMVFIAAGMGGGTGTGASPIVAKISKELGALTVAVVTSPFSFEGPKVSRQAKEGLADLRENVDSIIVVSNDRLLSAIGRKPMTDAFKEADSVLRQAVQTITDLIAIPAFINLDFADVSSVMRDRGSALIGIGMSTGESENKAEEAALRAISSPLLDVSITGAKDAIVNVTGGKNISLYDAHVALNTIKEAVGNEVNTILGVAINDAFDDEIIVTVIATGFEKEEEAAPVQKNTVHETTTNTVRPTVYDVVKDEDDEDEALPEFLRNRKL